MPQRKILCAAPKTGHGQINIKKKKSCESVCEIVILIAKFQSSPMELSAVLEAFCISAVGNDSYLTNVARKDL